MENIERYYNNTEDALPHPFVQKFINMGIKPDFAIDLGCGAGRDTIYLLHNGWKVLAIDKEDTKEFILKKLDNEETKRFSFKCQSFENIEIEKNNLLVANFSIPFCDKDCFNDFWKRITNSVLKERLFCWEFFRIKRFLDKYKKANGIFIKETSFKFI